MTDIITLTYQNGREDLPVACCTRRSEVINAVQAWSEARYDHDATSYFRAAHSRGMFAYWLGVLRLQREHNLGFHTFHHHTNPTFTR